MLDKYFFFPADKNRFLQKIKDLDSDYYVLDLEDAVSECNKNIAFENVMSFNIKSNMYLRIPINDNSYTAEQIKTLIKKAEGKIILPKVECLSDLELFISNIPAYNYQIILLVENPKCIINLEQILMTNHQYIEGIGFGSHDLCSIMGMKHERKYLNWYRQKLILLAKSYNLKFIDGVDINLNDFSNFKDECIEAYGMGADGKFMIHPNQLIESNLNYISINEMKLYLKVFEKANSMNSNEIDIIKVDGEIFEKPHVNKIIKIVNRYNKKYLKS